MKFTNRGEMQKAKHRNNDFVSNVIFYAMAFITSMVVGAYLYKFAGLAYEYKTGVVAGFVSNDSGLVFAATSLLIGVVLFALVLFCDKYRKVPRWLIRHRFALSAVVLVVCCVLEISGSSIAIWSEYLGGTRAEGTLFGIPRGIRSDEWDVTTPFAFSQVVTGNQPESPVIRGGGTDVTLLPALPSWSFTTLFRPYYWGYLFLGEASGLSFSWVGRLLALALISFEVARVITRRNDALSVCAAILVAFSPVVEWWFATNLLIFGQALVLCFRSLLNANSLLKRWALACLLAYLLCCYALELYPAWQVPYFYIFLAMGAWFAWRLKTEKGVSWAMLLKPAIAPMLVAIALCIAVVAWVVWQAADVVAIVQGTSYPGGRNEHGGGSLAFLLSYLECGAAMVVAPLAPDAFEQNVCVSSTAIALVPFGFTLLVYYSVKRRNAEALFLLAPFCLLMLYGTVGFPEFLAKITLLSNTLVERLAHPLGYLEIIMLVFAVSETGAKCDAGVEGSKGKLSPQVKIVGALVVAVLYAIASVLAARAGAVHGLPRIAYVIVATFSGLGALAVLLPSSVIDRPGRSRGHYLLVWAVVVFVAGMCINPVQRGIAELTENSIIEEIAEVNGEDPGKLWVGEEVMYGQACVSVGARTLSSVNSYPNLEAWRTIDPDGDYEDVYNRYAHIAVQMSDETRFELTADDRFTVFLDDEDVLDLGIEYWLARSDLSEFESELIEFEPLSEGDYLTVYKVIPEESS